jgi:hypothetical protein
VTGRDKSLGIDADEDEELGKYYLYYESSSRKS